MASSLPNSQASERGTGFQPVGSDVAPHGREARATSASAVAAKEFPALREWAASCDAVEAGRQVLLIRKGGIAEPEFEVESKRFLLLPTLFHQAHGAPPALSEVEVWVLCELVATAEVGSDFPLEEFAAFHEYDPEQLGTRLRYKPEKPLTLMAIRPFRLVTPFALDLNRIRPVCKSWLSVPVGEVVAANPVETRASVVVLAEKLSKLENFHVR